MLSNQGGGSEIWEHSFPVRTERGSPLCSNFLSENSALLGHLFLTTYIHTWTYPWRFSIPLLTSLWFWCSLSFAVICLSSPSEWSVADAAASMFWAVAKALDYPGSGLLLCPSGSIAHTVSFLHPGQLGWVVLLVRSKRVCKLKLEIPTRTLQRSLLQHCHVTHCTCIKPHGS